jgi:hypothetical protein
MSSLGVLAAALLAERMGWPGTPVNAVLACQHKLYAREVLDRVCPEANTRPRQTASSLRRGRAHRFDVSAVRQAGEKPLFLSWRAK